MVGIHGSFTFTELVKNPEALQFFEDIWTSDKINGVNNHCPWFYDDEEGELIWRCNDEYDDDVDIQFNDCVLWLKYIITTLTTYDNTCILNGVAIWVDLAVPNNTEYKDCMRKITVVNNVIETYSVQWVSDTKCTKSASKVGL